MQIPAGGLQKTKEGRLRSQESIRIDKKGTAVADFIVKFLLKEKSKIPIEVHLRTENNLLAQLW